MIVSENGEFTVEDTIHLQGGKVGHVGVMTKGMFKTGDTVTLKVDEENRALTARNHSATHLLHKALRTVLGDHVEQAGSLVTRDRLRFDFTHFSPVTQAELDAIENLVNEEILKNIPVTIEEMPIDDAKEKGAMALFGEKYGDVVRVVSVDDFSCELCGGSHVDNTSVIGSFRITGESGTGSGVRRIEAVTGEAALAVAKAESRELQQLADLLKAKVGDTTAKLEALLAQAKGMEKELAQLKKEAAMSDMDSILAGKEDIGGVSVITL